MIGKMIAKGVGGAFLLGVCGLSYAGCAPQVGDESVNEPADVAGMEEPYDFEQENVGEATQALWTASPLPPAFIPMGLDCFYTAQGTVFDFSGYAIPANFFMPGSAAFTSKVPFGHRGATGDDTCMKRYFNLDFTNAVLPATLVTPIRLRTLTMQAVGPQMITVNGNPTYWRVWVDLSPSTMTATGGTTATSPSLGSMTVTKTSAEGGSFDSTFFVKPRFTFFKCTDNTCSTLANPAVTKVFDFVQQFPGPFHNEIELSTTAMDWMTPQAAQAAFDDLAASPPFKIMDKLCNNITPGFQKYCGQNFIAGFRAPPPQQARCCPVSCHFAQFPEHVTQTACCPYPACPFPANCSP